MMNIGKIEATFELKNFSDFKEWYDNYEKEIIIPYSEHIYPETVESRRMINAIVTEINKTIKDKWISFGCDIPEIRYINVENHFSV